MTKTNAYTLLCMIIRAVAVFTLATFVIALPSMVIALGDQTLTEGTMGPVMVAMVVAVGVIAGLWLFADKVAKLALVRPQDQVFESSLEPTAWLGVAISAIGAWHLFAGLKNALYLLPKWLILLRADELGMGVEWDSLLPDGIATVAQVALALVFLLRGPGLARLFHRLRYGAAGAPGEVG